ncbi:MAG: RHS repeat-associated core domain-containing protein [Protaetiibacter sp.]
MTRGTACSSSYDDAGQLTADSIDGHSRSYAFDAVGQLASSTDTSGTLDFSASSAGRLNSLGGTSLGYDASQALTSAVFSSSATAVFAQDGNGSRIGAAVNAGPETEYGYDVFGDLISVEIPSGPSIEYTADGDGLRRTRATSPTSSDAFVWDVSGGLPLLLSDGGHSYLYGPTSTPLAQIDSATGDVEYLHGDLIGSVRLITDDAADDVGSVAYDPYGRVTSRTGSSSVFGYSGNWVDPDTGFVYLRARDYDPGTGQFIQVDPAVDETRQPYAYAGNNPLQFADPTGLCIGMDGTPQDRPCTSNDFFWGADSQASMWSGIGQGIGTNFANMAFGIGDAVTWGPIWYLFGASSGTEALRNWLTPNIECQIPENGFYTFGALWGGAAAGAATAGLANASTTLYRSVSQAELDDLLSTGAFRAGANSLEGKWFAESASSAVRWGGLLNSDGAVIATRVPKGYADSLLRIDSLDGIGAARYADDLDLLNKLLKGIGVVK